MSFLRHQQIYQSDVVGALLPDRGAACATAPGAHCLDESAAGYSSAGSSSEKPTCASLASSYAQQHGGWRQPATEASNCRPSPDFYSVEAGKGDSIALPFPRTPIPRFPACSTILFPPLFLTPFHDHLALESNPRFRIILGLENARATEGAFHVGSERGGLRLGRQ